MTGGRESIIMKFLLLLLIAFLTDANAFAEGWDYSCGAGIRTLPFGSSAFGSLGYGKIFWGEKEGADSYKYGYFRPGVRVQSSGLTNRAEAFLDFYPISFLGFSVGHYEGVRFTDTRTVNCVTAECRGLIGSSFVRSKFLAGYARFFFMAGAELHFLRSSSAKPFSEETSSLVGQTGGDKLFSYDLSLGLSLRDNLRAGLLHQGQRMINSGSANDLEALFFQWSRGALSIVPGAGLYHSTTAARSPTFFLALRWVGVPSVGLF